MAFNVSPGVTVKEIDLTTVVPAVSTTIGGYAGAFNWGPVDEIRLISSEIELAKTFGTPTAETATSFLTAASFLKYGSALKAVRSVGASALNATSGKLVSEAMSYGQLIKNKDDFDANVAGTNTKGFWAAKYPGMLGQSLTVEVCPSVTAFNGTTGPTAQPGWTYKSNFTDAPGTSAAAAAADCTADEMHVVVVDRLGLWSGAAGTVLEKFAFVSQAADARTDDGASNYYIDVINNNSKYVWAVTPDTQLTEAGKTIAAKATGEEAEDRSFNSANSNLSADLLFGAGVTETSMLPSDANVISSFELAFSDAETVDVNLLFASAELGNSSFGPVVAEAIRTIAENRKDCLAFVSPPIALTTAPTTDALDDVIDWSDSIGSSSYVVLDSTAVKVYDKYNDVYRWITASGHMAGLCAKTDQNADAWFSPAGVTRGSLMGVTKIAFNPNKAQRDELFKKRVNPIVALPGAGVVLYGDKTGLAKPSAFDAINVRRLFIVLEKSIATAAKAQLFEFNDEFTRAAFRNAVEPFLRDVQGRRGITDFRVVCDETNNTTDVIDRNEFVADIYIKPARAIRGITLNFIATRTGVAFDEITA